jgi:acyl-CoA dehydrogenase
MGQPTDRVSGTDASSSDPAESVGDRFALGTPGHDPGPMAAQSYAYGSNAFLADPDVRALLSTYWPDWTRFRAELEAFGALAGTEVLDVAYHVDHDAPPVLVTHDLDGRRIDRARISPAEARLWPRLAAINRAALGPDASWHRHYTLGYLLADPGLYCLVTITGQTAYVIEKYAPRHVAWKDALLDGKAVGATWLTEIQGGSDVGANVTRAERSGDGWRLYGEKYFASGAGLTDLAVVTARPQGAPPGPKGVALFLVPRLNGAGELNFTVRRLKDKSATRAVPSGEVELDGSEAWLVGAPDQGIYYALEMLTVSRLANAVAAVGIGRKAQAEVLERVRRRAAFGRRLVDQPLIQRDLTDLAVRLAGGLALAFHAVDAFDRVWTERPPFSPAYHAARLYAHVAKARTADHAAATTAMAMELFGGLGFLEEYAVARWHREALITPIWEGPANVQALDLLEVLTKKQGDQVLEHWLSSASPLGALHTPGARLAQNTLRSVLSRLRENRPAAAVWYAKDTLTRIADALQVGLLYRTAEAGGERWAKLAELYATRFLAGDEYPDWAAGDREVWWPQEGR